LDSLAFWQGQAGYLNSIIIPILIVVCVIFPVIILLFLLGFYRRIRLWLTGRPEKRTDNKFRRLMTTLAVAVPHISFFKKNELYPSFMHLSLFGGTALLFLGKIVRLFALGGVSIPPPSIFLWASLVSEIGGVIILIGGAMAVFRRYILKPKRLDTKEEDTLVFVFASVIILTGFMIKGYRIATSPTIPTWSEVGNWSPVGYLISRLFLIFGLTMKNELLVWHRVIIHTIPALFLLGYVWVNRSRLQHVVLSPLNVFFRTLKPKGELTPIDLEKVENFGNSQIEHFTWKQLLDLDACTRCGRCQDACPAFASGKKLSPKKLIQDLKSHMQQVYPYPFVNKPIDPRPDMISEAVTDEVIWDCTTCRACEQSCPIYVERIDKVVDMRRSLTMERTQLPESAQEALKSLSTRDHPWRGTTLTRTAWTEGLDVKTMAEDSNVDILYWVGCTGALDERNVKVSRAMVKILRAAGVKFGILGTEEGCCGDPARRMGDEYLFQTLCQKNIEILKQYNVKKILTACPHGYNSFKYEYPQFGGNYEVVHHTQLIAELIRDGKVKLNKLDGNKTVTYHDSCYLGRYNSIYNEPREILQAAGLKKVEMAKSGSISFCCGGGGGHMWMEEDPEKRLNVKRAEQVIQTKANMVATACPYCLVMLVDGLKTKGVEEAVGAKDIAEIVAELI
jgi:Fe-S oxidoreductase/nitrate reductase gamma subunit